MFLVNVLDQLVVPVFALTRVLSIVFFKPDDGLLIVSFLLQHSLLLEFALIDALLGLILGCLNDIFPPFVSFDLALVVFHYFDHIVNILFQHIVILS